MEFWTEIDREVNIYRWVRSEQKLEEILIMMKKYIKASAENAKRKSEIYNLSIPFEDFLSAFYIAVWESVEAYSEQQIIKYSIKNMILFRMSLAEKSVWRLYKSNTCSSADKNGIS